MWTTERPVVTGARGIPNFVLLSSDGEVVLKGNLGQPGGLFFTPDPPGLEVQGADGPAADPLHLHNR